jgi:8-oxo-dGTP diphosphatase
MRNQSASGVVIRGDEVLLVRHTYGMLKGKFLIPGGIVEEDEMPMECVEREVEEEAGVKCQVGDLVCVRFRPESWWACFRCDYISGEPRPDGHETDRSLFMNLHDAINNSDVTETMRFILKHFVSGERRGFAKAEYQSQNFGDSRYAIFI